ncbi:MAG: radical SAM protein [Elusimicrobia bacterium]|nr:radical SAM protein [Elusimicrobiota bacterium]
MGSEIKLIKPMAGVSALINRKERTLCISVRPGRTELETARAFLYGALNTYENRFSVFVKGVPFCFLPDAYDHILRPKSSRRKAARLDICSRCRLSRLCPGLEPGSIFLGPAGIGLKPVLEIPLEIVIEVNRRCNLACAVCSSGSLTAKLSLPEIRSHLAAARALGVKNIRFTGGEPFLHPKILEALAAAKKLGFYVLVNTNATLLDAKLIKKAAPFIDNILVSMQGCDAESEAAATGTRGLFSKKIKNIRLLRRSGIGVLRLGTVISKELITNFEKYRALAEGLKAEIWELYRPMGSNTSLPKEFRITLKDLRRLVRRLEPRLGLKPRTLFANPVPFCLFKKRQAPLFLGASFDDGHTRLVLDPRGFYKPSYYIQKKLGAEPFKAWNSRLLKNISGPARLRSCRSCIFRLRCLGGSRFMARAESGNYSGKDPYLKDSHKLQVTGHK